MSLFAIWITRDDQGVAVVLIQLLKDIRLVQVYISEAVVDPDASQGWPSRQPFVNTGRVSIRISTISSGQMAGSDTKDAFSFSGYRHLHDSTNHIRLLEVSRHDGQTSLCCRLKHHRIDDAPPYHALSYCWGEPGEEHEMTVDAVTVTIYESAGAFLKSLQHIYGDVLVWIDMLCINQRDTAERNSQVELMGDIYRRALSVYVWLGSSDKTSDLAFKKGLEVSLLKDPNTFEPWGDKNSNSPKYWQNRSNCEIRPALGSLFLKPYWTRVWIIQELVLARKITFVCGLSTLPYKTILRMCTTYQMAGFDDENKTTFYKGWQTFDKVGAIRGATGVAHVIFAFFQHNKCTDLRDKVYGLRQLLPNPSALPVDYSKTTLDVFLDVLRTGILENRSDAFFSADRLLVSMGETSESLAAYPRLADHLDLNLTA